MTHLSFDLNADNYQSFQVLDNKIIQTYAILKGIQEDELMAIHKYARVSMIGASTRIENALLTDIEVDWIDTLLSIEGTSTAFDNNRSLIRDKLSKDRERSIEEVAGCRAMLNIIYQDAKTLLPFRESDLRSLHTELLAPYSKARHYLGKYKEQPNFVVQENKATGEKRVVFKTADAGPITQAAMADLIQWYNDVYQNELKSLAIAAEFTYRFLAIHPFQDGNGRIGRGLFVMALLQSRNEAMATIARYIPIDRYIERHKEEYYFVLNRCSGGEFKQEPREYKIIYFFEFMVKVVSEALDSIEFYRKRYSATRKLSDAARMVLRCFKEHPEIRLSTKKIAEETNLQTRTISYSLATLLELELIQKYGQGSATKYQLTF